MAKIQHPYTAFRFKLEVDGITLGHFKSCNGLKHDIEVLEHQEGGVNEFKHKLVGQGSYPNVTLKMGFVSNGIAQDWHYEYATADAKDGERKTVRIIMLDNDGSTVVGEWTFQQAWPVKWEGPEFDSSSDNIAIETLEIAHHGILRVKQKASPELDPTQPGGGRGGRAGTPSLPGGLPALPAMPAMPGIPAPPAVPGIPGGGAPPTDPAAAANEALDRARRGATAAARRSLPF